MHYYNSESVGRRSMSLMLMVCHSREFLRPCTSSHYRNSEVDLEYQSGLQQWPLPQFGP